MTIKNAGIALERIVVSDLNGRMITSFSLDGMSQDKLLDLSSVLSTGLFVMIISSENSVITKN